MTFLQSIANRVTSLEPIKPRYDVASLGERRHRPPEPAPVSSNLQIHEFKDHYEIWDSINEGWVKDFTRRVDAEDYIRGRA